MALSFLLRLRLVPALLALGDLFALVYRFLSVSLLIKPFRVVLLVCGRLRTGTPAGILLPLLQLLHFPFLLRLAFEPQALTLLTLLLPLPLILRTACGLIGRLGLLIICQRLIHHSRVRHCLRRKCRCLRRLLLWKLRRSCIPIRSVLSPAFIHRFCVFIQKILYVGKEFIYLTVQFLDVKAVSVVHKKAPFFWSITKSRVFCTFRPCFDILL